MEKEEFWALLEVICPRNEKVMRIWSLEEVERRQGEDESGGYAKVQLFIGKDDL